MHVLNLTYFLLFRVSFLVHVFGSNVSIVSGLRAYQEAMEAIETAGSDAEAMEKAMEQFERASTTMDRVGGWDAETFALQVNATCHVCRICLAMIGVVILSFEFGSSAVRGCGVREINLVASITWEFSSQELL